MVVQPMLVAISDRRFLGLEFIRTCGWVSPDPFQPVSGSGRCGSRRSNSSSHCPALALPDWVALRSSSEMRAVVMRSDVAKSALRIKAIDMCASAFAVLNRSSFLKHEGGANDIEDLAGLLIVGAVAAVAACTKNDGTTRRHGRGRNQEQRNGEDRRSGRQRGIGGSGGDRA